MQQGLGVLQQRINVFLKGLEKLNAKNVRLSGSTLHQIYDALREHKGKKPREKNWQGSKKTLTIFAPKPQPSDLLFQICFVCLSPLAIAGSVQIECNFSKSSRKLSCKGQWLFVSKKPLSSQDWRWAESCFQQGMSGILTSWIQRWSEFMSFLRQTGTQVTFT